MAIEKINIQEFIEHAGSLPILDVRSPGEYHHAHIPGAFSLPLFADEERKVVGTAYKQESRQRAIKIGLEYFGTKTVGMIEAVEEIIGNWQLPNSKEGNGQLYSANSVIVHCWRGGMRSAAVAWLLDLYGFKVYTLAGGYKTFRKWVLLQFEKEYDFKIIGGYTGSGKTNVLTELRRAGQTIIDLEALANHKGSAFGNLGESRQPSQEMFENKVALELQLAVQGVNAQAVNKYAIWLEDESQRIGDVNIPPVLFNQMRTKEIMFLEIPFEERLENIVTAYGKFEKEKLMEAIQRIKKRLGGLETKTAVSHLLENDLKNCFAVLLKYYDKWYIKGLHNRENLNLLLQRIQCTTVDARANAELLLELHKEKYLIND